MIPKQSEKYGTSLSKLAQVVKYSTMGKCYGNTRDTLKAEREVSKSWNMQAAFSVLPLKHSRQVLPHPNQAKPKAATSACSATGQVEQTQQHCALDGRDVHTFCQFSC